MPFGCFSCVPEVVAQLTKRPRRSVLDLGIGMGFYGAVVRQWLDRGAKPWATALIGVEAWPAYRNPAWDLYDHVYTRTIEEFLAMPSVEEYDAILLLDVLEHFVEGRGNRVLEEAAKHLTPGGSLIVATPSVWMEQGPAHGNDYETHRSLWDVPTLTYRGFTIHNDGTPDKYGHYMIVASRDREA